MSVAVLAAAFFFNLGQGVLRPSLPLYLQQFFAANYRMVTLIPVIFGAGKWLASLPTGYLLDRLGRTRLMVSGLLVIAACDIASVFAPGYSAFLSVRGVAGAGWAMFATVATTTMIDRSVDRRRGRAVSLLLMSETIGLLLGSTAGGRLYQDVGMASPFVFEAMCMVLAAGAVACFPLPASKAPAQATRERHLLRIVLRVPGVMLMSLTNAALAAVQTGVLVFLFPLYLSEQGRLRPDTVGYIVAQGVLGRLAALWLAGGASDGSRRATMLRVGLLGYGLALGSLTLVIHPVLLGLWSFMIGGGAGFVAGLPTAIIGDQVGPDRSGVAVGWLRTVTDTGMLVGPLVMGALADGVHPTAPFVVAGALLCLLAWPGHRPAMEVAAP
ncbi:MAG TPA: MFS transporter [Candidatus Dormibacteraeota bacterium]|nr:MFS transporter [Candidatus Dormibacteraeota bacterium]